MRKLKLIIKWYLIGITAAGFFLVMLILIGNIKHPESPKKYHNVPQIILGFGAFAGIVAYAGFGKME
jgi:hypothetical protein